MVEVLDTYGFAIEFDTYFAFSHSCQIIGPFGHQTNDISIHDLHFEFRQIRIKGDAGEVCFLRFGFNNSLVFLQHIVSEHLLVVLVGFGISCLNYEFGAKDISKLSAEAVSATSCFLFGIVVIGRSQQLSKDHLWHVALVLLVHLYRNASSVVPNRYLVLLCINLNLNQVHGVVSLEIVCSVNKNLIYGQNKVINIFEFDYLPKIL